MKVQRKDKLKLVATGITAGLVISTVLLWAIVGFIKGEILWPALSAVIAPIVIIGSAILLWKQYRSAKEGFPVQDERTRRLFVYAAYRAFLISIYWLLAVSLATDYGIIEFRDIQQAIGAGILGMVIILGLCYLWVSRTGDKL